MADTTPRPALWIDRLTWFVLAAGAGSVLVTAAPVVLRAGGWVDGRASVVVPEAPPPPRRPTKAPPRKESVTEENPTFAPDEPESPLSEIERMIEERQASGMRRLPNGRKTNGREGRALLEIRLLKEPDPRAAPMQKIPAGEPLIIVRSEGLYVLVMHQSASGVDMGWAPETAVGAEP